MGGEESEVLNASSNYNGAAELFKKKGVRGGEIWGERVSPAPVTPSIRDPQEVGRDGSKWLVCSSEVGFHWPKES